MTAGAGRSWSAVEIADAIGLHRPTAEQVAVVEAPPDAPLLVIAGAGSGKTETMASRVVWLVANGFVRPEQVLGLTFTRKAAGELADRVQRRLERFWESTEHRREGVALLDRPAISTYNAYAAGLVRDHALRLGLEPGARVLSDASQWQLASDVVEHWQEDLGLDRAVSSVVDAVRGLAGQLAEHLLDVPTARAAMLDLVDQIDATPPPEPGEKGKKEHYAETLRLRTSLLDRVRLLDVVAAYQERKRAADAVDFGDQVAVAARLALEVPAVGVIERGRYRAVLLDEYQDTSAAQVDLLAALFGAGHGVTAVGDPHQSIYGWRGASAGGIGRFPERFRARPATPHVPGARAALRSLGTSWRNDRSILAVANVTAAELSRRTAVPVPALTARPDVGPGLVRASFHATEDEEAAAVADVVVRAREAVADGEAPPETAVLCRRRAQFPRLEAALRSRGVPVEVVGLGGLLDTPEVSDVVAFLQVAHDPSRGDALARLLTGPRIDLGAADLFALSSRARDLARADERAGRGTAAASRRHARTAEGLATAPGDAAVEGDTAVVGGAAVESDATVMGGAAVEDDVVVEGDVVDHRSLVDALDDLPDPGRPASDGRALTVEGHRRLAALARDLRLVRSLTYLSLPELLTAAERALGLDVEVEVAEGLFDAGVPGGAERGRAHLDALQGVAADFAQSADQPTLGAFLAWLGAAQAQEDGLDLPVRPKDPTAVQLITVHGAKGLEWDVVAVPGLVDGAFPKVAASGDGPKDKGWTESLSALPYVLRGDRADLPELELGGAVSPLDLKERVVAFQRASGLHQLDEERRLAYVAFTRARRELHLSGACWGDGSRPRVPSPFLTELVDQLVDQPTDEPSDEPAGEHVDGGAVEPVAEQGDRLVEQPASPVSGEHHPGRGGGQVVLGTWFGAPEPDATNPLTDQVRTARWPSAERSPARVAVHRAAELVRDAMAAGVRVLDDGRVRDDGAVPEGAVAARAADDRVLARLLLDERDAEGAGTREVAFPAHVSASGLVAVAADRDAYALQRRRPVPREPSPAARRGTRFHGWVERYYGAPSLLDLDDLPGSGGTDGEDAGEAADEARLRETFLASPWARRTPVAVEVDLETPVGDVVVRCRIDAVFASEDGTGAVVVDWKTGRAPRDDDSRRARAVQLAAYRLAWARWSGLPLERVSAAFYHVADDVTVTPVDLLDAAGLEALVAGELSRR